MIMKLIDSYVFSLWCHAKNVRLWTSDNNTSPRIKPAFYLIIPAVEDLVKNNTRGSYMRKYGSLHTASYVMIIKNRQEKMSNLCKLQSWQVNLNKVEHWRPIRLTPIWKLCEHGLEQVVQFCQWPQHHRNIWNNK